MFQIKGGDCIGGYINLRLESPEDGKFMPDSSAFLFNLTRSRNFPSKTGNQEIFCSSNWGPRFSGGIGSELAAFQPFNRKKYCISRANQAGYKIPIKDEKNQLTNLKDGSFTISELEVWFVEEY